MTYGNYRELTMEDYSIAHANAKDIAASGQVLAYLVDVAPSYEKFYRPKLEYAINRTAELVAELPKIEKHVWYEMLHKEALSYWKVKNLNDCSPCYHPYLREFTSDLIWEIHNCFYYQYRMYCKRTKEEKMRYASSKLLEHIRNCTPLLIQGGILAP